MTLLLLAACGVKPSVESCPTCGGECQDETLAETTRSHTSSPIDYTDTPPTNGDHNPCWATWGAHTEELADENWVHNLEHGGVVFLYNCPDGCEDDVATLTTWTATLDPGRWVLTPYSLMDWSFAAVAWDHRLLVNCVDTDAFQAFYDEHAGRAPEDDTLDPSGCM